MKRLFGLIAIAAAIMFASANPAQAQAYDVNAADFTQWEMFSDTAVLATSGQVVTFKLGNVRTTSKGVRFNPIASTTNLKIDRVGTAETISTLTTPTCTPDGADPSQQTCTFTATFAQAHAAGFRISSGDFGLDEAVRASKTGDLVYVKKTTSVTLTAAATFAATDMIPAGVYLDGITVNVTTAITKAGGATTLWTFGDGTTADLWGTGLALAAGTKTTYANYKTNYGSIGIVKAALTPTGTATTDNFAGGVVQINTSYHVIVN